MQPSPRRASAIASKMIAGNGPEHPAVPRQEAQATGGHAQHAGAPIVRIPASLDHLLFDELRELSTHGRARADVQELQAFQSDRLAAFLRVSNFDNYIELDERPEEREPALLVLPGFFEVRQIASLL